MGEQGEAEADTQTPATARQGTDRNRDEIKVRLHPDTKQRVKYWAARHGLRSANEYITEAVEEKIARENGDYDLPTLTIGRMDQLIDEIKGLRTNVANLQQITVTGWDAMTRLARGDNYLLDPETGELDGGEDQG
jgi:predicted DNA-binding protein